MRPGVSSPSLHVYSTLTTNETLSKHCKAKRICICQRGVLIVKDVHIILSRIEVDKQIRRIGILKEEIKEVRIDYTTLWHLW